MKNALVFNLDQVELIFKKPLDLSRNSRCGLLIEVTISPEVRAAILANKNRFIRHIIVPGDSFSAGTLKAS